MLGRGCVWVARWLRVQAVNRCAIRPWNEMAIDVNGHLDARVSELLLHIGERLALLNQETREGVPKVMDANAPELRFLEEPVEHAVPEVVSIHAMPCRREEHAQGHRLPGLEGHAFPRRPETLERLRQGQGHVDAAPLLVLRQRQLPRHEVAPACVGSNDCGLFEGVS